MEARLVVTMAALRLFSCLLELGGAILMLHYGRVEHAFQVNAWLGIIGPAIFFLVSIFGLAGMVNQIPPIKVAMLFGAVILILMSAAL